MKKLLMFLFLMTISLGQSQSLVGTWKVTSIGVGGGQGQTNYFSLAASSGARACFFDDEYVFDADGDFHNVQQGSTFLEVWQGGGDACGTPVAPHDGSNAATYSSTATTLTLTGVGAHLGLAKVISDSEISSPSAAPASITYLLTSLTSTTLTVDVALTNGAWWRFVLSNEVVAPPPPVAVPTVAANTPTQAAEDVISIFSGAYTNVGVSTFRTDWSSAGQETVSIDGNSTLKYTALNYAGIDINPANQINATSMETFHIDMWTPDCTTFKVKIVDFGADGAYGGGDDREHEVTRTPIQNGWNSFDLSLSEFTGLTTRANVNQLVLSSSGGIAYVDNIYFWKVPAGSESYYVDADGDGYGAGAATVSSTPIVGSVTNGTDCNDASSVSYPGATEIADGLDNDCDGSVDEGFPPSTAAPTPPTRNAWDVVSVFSGAYSNIALDELPTEWSQLATAPFSVESIGGNDTWKFGGEFLGMAKYSGNGLNLTQMETLHIDYWTADPNLLILKIVNTVDGGDATTIVEDPTQTGSWRSRDIPMSTFGGSINKSKITQLLIDPQSGGSTVYVDNFYFYRAATGAPSPTIGALTVPASVIGDASFELTAPSSDSAGAFTFTSSNPNVATISGTTVTIVGAGSSVITATQAADGSLGAGSTQATLVVSLNEAAPTPTIPVDRVLSVYSGAAGYGTLADTNFYPNWGQATQYAQVDVIGNPTLRYSNLNYQGIQLGSVLDISSYDSVHLNIYGGGTTAVNFVVINQEGGAGSTDVKREALTAITLNPGWNSVVIPVASLTTATPGFELNRVGQLMFTGSGTIFVDNIFFSKAVPTPVAPTATNIAFCKGAVSALTAVALGTNPLKWYTAATGGTALASAPTPTATKTYHVSQVMSSGVESSRATLVATVNNLPATPSAITSSEAKNICKYIGSSTQVTFNTTAVNASSYIWTAPEGAVIENDGAQAFISFEEVSTVAGSIGSVTVKIEDATNGCISLPRALALTTTLPKAPTSLTMTSADTAAHFKGITTPAVVVDGITTVPAVYGLVGLNSLVKITKVGPYMGTATEFTLTAAEAPTAASYEWTLNGATQLTGGNGRIITVDFSGVEPGIGSLPIVVQSVGGCGPSTARTLTLARAVPTAPTKLVLTDEAIELSTTVTTKVVTKVGPYTGKSTPLTLTATPFTTQGGTATSYAWILPAGVTCETSNTPTMVKVKSTVNTGTTEVPVYLFDDVAAIATASSTITINLDDVESAVVSLPLKVFAVNGAGNSIARTLTLTAAAPATPAIVGSGGNGTSAQFGSCLSKTYTATLIPGATYNWTVPGNAPYTGGNGNVIVVDYSGTTLAVGLAVAVTCSATNGTGTSGVKSLTVKRIACTTPAPRFSDVTEKFSAVAYPNPSTEGFRVKSSNGKSFGVQVYDMLGRSIEKRQMSSDAQIGSNYAKGIYNVIVNQGANVKTLRVIKK